MTTYQFWKNEGIKEAHQERVRLAVLRARWHDCEAESLADTLELPLSEVNDLLAAYDNVYKFWVKSKGKAPDVLPKITHLSDQEVGYLMAFFTQKQSAAAKN